LKNPNNYNLSSRPTKPFLGLVATLQQLFAKNHSLNSRQNGEMKNFFITTNSMTPWRRASLHSLVGEQGKPSAANVILVR
jgi:hypothetical protein